LNAVRVDGVSKDVGQQRAQLGRPDRLAQQRTTAFQDLMLNDRRRVAGDDRRRDRVPEPFPHVEYQIEPGFLLVQVVVEQ
jgi:hypothetical protein